MTSVHTAAPVSLDLLVVAALTVRLHGLLESGGRP
jgi:hypothetical protein